MAWDLARTPTTGVNVQACGDAHVLNFGGYASPERRLVFDVNDFDETLPAPWEYDLKRLVASVVLDGRVHGFSEDQAADAVRVSVDRYRRVTRALAEMTSLDIHFAHIESRRFLAEVDDPAMAKATRKYVRKARRRTNVQAFRKWVAQVDGRYRFVDDPPLLERLPDEQAVGFHGLYNTYRSTLRGDRRHLLEQYRFRDAARKVVGVGSVGLRAYVLLLEGRADPDPLLLQVKEAVPSVLTPYVGRSGYPRDGQRVVAGQRLMQAVSDPFLGWAPFAERDYYVRQLRDMKGPGVLAPSLRVFEASAALTAGTLARAHARSLDPAVIRGYLGKGEVFREALVSFARDYATVPSVITSGSLTPSIEARYPPSRASEGAATARSLLPGSFRRHSACSWPGSTGPILVRR
jgi:uncharacterized protein (DUF2252 family)